MPQKTQLPRGLFLGPNGTIYPDSLVCSGVIPEELNGLPCPFSENGRLPLPQPLKSEDPTYTIDKGEPGDYCPPCAKQQLSNLAHWQGHGDNQYPEELLGLRLFKCRQWFWLVVPGLYEADATNITQVAEDTLSDQISGVEP